MSIHIEPSGQKPATTDREKEARKLFGYVVKQDRDKLYDQLHRPAPSSLPREAGIQLTAGYVNEFGQESGAQDLLFYGLSETQEFILGILEHHPAISFDRAIQIAQHRHTIKSLAIMARQNPNREIRPLSHPGDTYDLSHNQQSIEVADSITPSLINGCPAVIVVEGHVEPWPIFNRFATWAAQLALTSYYDHK